MAGTFTDPTAVTQAIGNNPGRVAELMQAHLTQQQCSAFEALIVPPKTDADLVEELTAIRLRFTRMKRDDLGGAIAWIDSKLDALT